MHSEPSSDSPNESESQADALEAYVLPEASTFAELIPDGGDGSIAERSLPHPHLGWALLWLLAFWAVQIAASVVVAIIAMILAIGRGENSQKLMEQAMADVTVIMIPVGTLFSVITAVAVAAIFYRRHFTQRLALLGMASQHWVISLLLVLPLAVIASEITNCASKVLPSINSEMLVEFAASPWPLVFVAACLFPAIGEEIFCRGFLGRGLVAHYGAVRGVFLASLLFGIMHIDPVQSIGAFTLGLGLHFIYLTTRSLLAPMLVHMLNNAFAFWVIRNYEWCPLPGLSPLPDGSQVHTPPAVIIAAIVAASGLLVLLYQTRTYWQHADSDLPGEGTSWSPGYVTAEQPPPEVNCRATTPKVNWILVAFVACSYLGLLAGLAIESQAALAP